MCHSFFTKTTQNKVKGPFFLGKCPFCYVMVGDCPYFLNKALDQVYSNKLSSCNPTIRIIIIYIYIHIYIYTNIYIYIYIYIYVRIIARSVMKCAKTVLNLYKEH